MPLKIQRTIISPERAQVPYPPKPKDIPLPISTPHKKQLNQGRLKLEKRNEKLRHFADRCITLDLDDGVKVNYGKFGDLLAEVKAVNGKKPQEA